MTTVFSWQGSIRTSDLSKNARHVALALSMYMSPNGEDAWPGQARLVDDTLLSESSVKRALRELETKGWVRANHPANQGRGMATVYQATFPQWAIEKGVSEDQKGVTVDPHLSRTFPDKNPVDPPTSDLQAKSTGEIVYLDNGSRARHPTARADLFEALAAVCLGVDPWIPGESKITERERGMVNRAASQLARVLASPDEVRERAEAFVLWVGQRPTPDNLVTHWSRLAEPRQRLSKAEVDAYQEEMRKLARRRKAEEWERDHERGAT